MSRVDVEAYLEQFCADAKIVRCFPQKILWLSGAPAAGKGTNTRYMIQQNHLCRTPLVASSLLKTPEMLAKINRGLLLDDRTVVEAVFGQLQKPDYRQGLLVDGFPRREGQAYSTEWLYQTMQQQGLHPQFSVVVLLVDEKESIHRQLQRGQKAKIYNERIKAGDSRTKREIRMTDLDPDIARHRYRTFMEETYPVLNSLKGKMPFVTIDTAGDFPEVRMRVINAMHQLKAMQSELDGSVFK